MGLIGTCLSGIVLGFHVFAMSPVTFLRNPNIYLQAMSDKKATISAGPNFAFDYMVRKFDGRSLDLSSMTAISNGSERCRMSTIQKFIKTFEKYGLSPLAVMPVYGLAEFTLLASGYPIGVVSKELGGLVDLGGPSPDTSLKIVDPESQREVAPGELGEIWLSGPSKALGYKEYMTGIHFTR
jgi:acyl-CoA synthetase (AMP-forming)/AMP-acid ligase II